MVVAETGGVKERCVRLGAELWSNHSEAMFPVRSMKALDTLIEAGDRVPLRYLSVFTRQGYSRECARRRRRTALCAKITKSQACRHASKP
jgi:hypothetical protein